MENTQTGTNEQQLWKEVDVYITVQADHNFYSKQNTYKREELAVGGIISDKGLDGRDVFGTIKVLEMTPYALTVGYGIYQHTLSAGDHKRLDTGGRDYASFELWLVVR